MVGWGEYLFRDLNDEKELARKSWKKCFLGRRKSIGFKSCKQVSVVGGQKAMEMGQKRK